MPRKTKRRVPAYLVEHHGRIFYRYRARVVHRGHEAIRNVFVLSEFPESWERSLAAVREHREEVLGALRRAVDDHLDGLELPTTLETLAGEWLADCEEREVRTDVERYRVEVLLETLGRELPAEALTADHVLEWRRRLRRERGLSKSSANAYLALLKMVLALAVRRGRLGANPAAAVSALPIQRPDPETLTVEQVRALFAALPKFERLQAERESARRARAMGVGLPSAVPLRGIVLTAYYTLARTGNVLRLRWEEVDVEGGVIRFAETKNTRRAGVRVVAPLRAPLRTFLSERWPGPGARGWVFPNPVTGEPFVDVRKAWVSLLRLANAELAAAGGGLIPEGFRLYNLRHSGASHLAASGAMSAAEIAELMGDTRVETVERRYFKLDESRLRRRLELAAQDPDLATIDALASPTIPPSKPGDGTGRKASDNKRRLVVN